MPQVNTGFMEIQQTDVNPFSASFGQTRWVPAGQNLTACPLPARYRSAEIREVVYRDDCGAGTSSGALYVLAEGFAVSLDSLDEANRQARAYFNQTAQTYARNNAECIAPGAGGGGQSGVTCEMVNGCWTGNMTDGQGNTYPAIGQDCINCTNANPQSCPQTLCV